MIHLDKGTLSEGAGMIGKYLPLLASSLRRKRLRTFFTLASITVAFLLFGLAESMRFAFQSGVDVAGADRLMTMHKVSFTQLLPASYESRIRSIARRRSRSRPQTWFGGWFRDERNQIPTFPTDPATYLAIYPEIVVPEDQAQAWIADRSGILVGRALVDLFGWKPGDKVPLKSAIWTPRRRLRHLGRHCARDLRPAAGRRHAPDPDAPGLLRGGASSSPRGRSAGT